MSQIDTSGSAIGKRLVKGLASTALGQAIPFAQSVLLLPLFIRAWGTGDYGRWLAIVALISYLGLADLGGQKYIGNLLAIHKARGETRQFTDVLSQGVSLFLAISLGGFALGIAALAVVSLIGDRSLGLFGSLEDAETLIIIFLATERLIAIPTSVYASSYRASGLYARGDILSNLIALAGLLVSVVLLLLPVSPVVFALSFLLSKVVNTIAIVIDTRRVIPECKAIVLSVDNARRARKFLFGATHFWLVSVAQSGNLQGVLLVIAAAASPEIVSLYATHRALANIAGYATVFLQSPLWAEFSHLWATAAMDRLRTLSFLAIKVSVLVTGVAAVLLWVAGPWLYPIWTRRELSFDATLFALMLVQAVLAAGWMTSSWSLLSANRHRATSYWSLANAAATVLLAMVLFDRFGVDGVAGGTLAADIACGFLVFPLLASRLLQVPPARVYLAILRPAVGVAVLLGAIELMELAGVAAPVAAVVAVVVMAYPMIRLSFGAGSLRRAAEIVRHRRPPEELPGLVDAGIPGSGGTSDDRS